MTDIVEGNGYNIWGNSAEGNGIAKMLLVVIYKEKVYLFFLFSYPARLLCKAFRAWATWIFNSYKNKLPSLMVSMVKVLQAV